MSERGRPRRRLVTLSALLVAVGLGSYTMRIDAMSSCDSTKHAERIRALDEEWKAAADRRDLDGMMAIYAEDARELLPGMPPIVGREAIREFYRGLLERFPRLDHEFEPEEILVADSGDLAVVRGTFRFTADTSRPDEVQSGKFVGVWRRRDGEWRLVINISNSDRPSTEP